MTIPEPLPGMVIHYAYLWRNEAARGREEATKDRPCAVVLATKREGGKTIAVVAPITHSPPGTGVEAIEIPPETKRRLKLDDARSWLITNDLNIFEWPGPDLRPTTSKGGFVYGYLPAALTTNLINAVREEIKRNRKVLVARTD